MIYGHLPNWILARTDLTATSKIVLMRMIALSQDGKRTIFFQYKKYSEELGMSKHTLVNCIKQLVTEDLISIVKNPNSWDKTNYFNISKKACSDNEEQTLDTTDSSKNELSIVQKMNSRECKNFTLDSSKNELSSSDRSLGRTKEESVVEIAREKNDNSNSAPDNLNDVPLPDDSDFYETEENTESEPDLDDLYGTGCTYNAQEAINPPKTTNYTSNTNNTHSVQSSNEIEGVRRQLTIPSSVEEVIPLIEKFKSAHKAEKVYEKLDVSFYAGKIFDYYAGGNNGVWIDSLGKEIPPYQIFPKVSAWIVNDHRAGKLQTILEGGPLSVEKLNGYFDEIDQKKKAEREAKMRQFGIKPPPVNATFEVLEDDERKEQKLLEAK